MPLVLKYYQFLTIDRGLFAAPVIKTVQLDAISQSSGGLDTLAGRSYDGKLPHAGVAQW